MNLIKVFALVCLFVKKPNYANISLKIMLILKYESSYACLRKTSIFQHSF